MHRRAALQSGVILAATLMSCSLVIVRAEASSRLKEIPIPTANSGPIGITTGPDGGVWFAEYDANKIGRVSRGIIREVSVPTSGSGPIGITVGPDGGVWFTEYDGNKIGRVDPTGAILEFSVPTFDSKPF